MQERVLPKVAETSKKYLAVWVAALMLLAFIGYGAVKSPNSSGADVSSLLAETTNAAAVDYFLKIDGIDGESIATNHKNEIEIISFSWGNNTPGLQQSTDGGSKVTVHDFHFTAKTSKASPKIMQAVGTGQHFNSAVLSIRKPGVNGDGFIKWTMTDVLISSYQTGGSGNDIPVDQFDLHFASIQFRYLPILPDGTAGTPVIGNYPLPAS